MSFKKLKSKYKKFKKLEDELNNVDFSEILGKEVILTKKCMNWYNEHGESIGVPEDEMDVVKYKFSGVIIDVDYDCYGYTFKVKFGNTVMILGIEDIKEVV